MEQNADGHNNKIVGGNTILGDAHFYISETKKNIENQSPKSLLTTESRQIEEETSNSDGINEEQSETALLESSQITNTGIDDDDVNVSVLLNPNEKYEDSRDKLLSIEQKVILLGERVEQLENTQKTLRQLIANNCTCIGALLYLWAICMKPFILKHKTVLFVTLLLVILISLFVGFYYLVNMSRQKY